MMGWVVWISKFVFSCSGVLFICSSGVIVELRCIKLLLIVFGLCVGVMLLRILVVIIWLGSLVVYVRVYGFLFDRFIMVILLMLSVLVMVCRLLVNVKMVLY